MKLLRRLIALTSLCGILVNASLSAKDLVTKETVRTAKSDTKKFLLKNKIPVNYRKVEGSDILHIYVNFHSGSRDLEAKAKPANTILFSTMAMAAEGYPKQKLFETTEKYGFILGCSGGIESSSCELGTINDYWEEGIKLLAAVVNNPALEKDDLKLVKDRYIANLKSEMSDPNAYANNIVNKVFYPEGHPYGGTYEDLLAAAPTVEQKDVKDLHAKILSASNLNISVVGSLDEKEVTKALSKYFGTLESKSYKREAVTAPKFEIKNSFVFESRDIPTAYIKIKFNSLGVKSNDNVAARFLTHVLSEELSDEIRTRQSLSYAVHSYTIQLSEGIGVISVSTSKPKETLAAVNKVVKKIKKQRYTIKELDNYKRIYTTTYYLTQEEHSSLAAALAASEFWYGSTDPIYEMPLALERVSPRELRSLAQQLLINFRIGVVYQQDKFKEKWAQGLIKSSVEKSTKKKKKKA